MSEGGGGIMESAYHISLVIYMFKVFDVKCLKSNYFE